MSSLFPDDAPSQKPAPSPLAERMRPRTFEEFVGQQALLAPGKPLREAIERDLLQSIILWGPPGTGKTTLARIIADTTKAQFVAFSAVLAGIKEIRDVMAEAERIRRTIGRRTIVFIDEIHRFNKAQQDAFLPRVEAGDIVLIGATTENPSFEVNAALLSRSKVFVLHGLTTDEVTAIIERALIDPDRGLGSERVATDDETLHAIAMYANGDARVALNLLELSVAAAPIVDGERRIDLARVEQTIQRRALLYDKSGEEHYNLISALHKSMRNSDPDATVYWLARMVEAAEDAHNDVAQPVPLHLRNAPTKLMKDLEYGKGYKYAHNEADAIADMSCLPSALEGRKYYEPKERGFEKEIKRRLDGWAEIKRKRRTP